MIYHHRQQKNSKKNIAITSLLGLTIVACMLSIANNNQVISIVHTALAQNATVPTNAALLTMLQ
jgi:hypothetical protein